MKNQVSPQYLREEKIYVTIIEVKSPVHYVIKESPNMNTTSIFATNFLELEESMQKYYRSLEKTFFQLPVKDTILIVEHEKKYYRARVCSILNLPRSYLIKVYLLDYGRECSVPKSSLFEIDPDFMSVPFQVIDFQLPGLEPMSLIMNPHDLSVEYGNAVDWDFSASAFIESIRKALVNAYIKVEGAANNCIFGTLHVAFVNEEEKCIKDELIFKKFATQNPECWNNITKLVDILSKGNLQSSPNISQSRSNNLEISACTISKSIPASESSSPESLKSSPASAIVPQPSKNAQKSGVAKLKEILKAKKSQEKSKISLPSEEKKEQEDLIRKIEESKATVLADVKGAINTPNKAVQNIDKHSTEREPVTTNQEIKSKIVDKDSASAYKDTVSKATEGNKCVQSGSVSPNVSTIKKFKEMVAMKRAAQKQQNTSQTLSDSSCSNSPSTRIENVQSELSPSTTKRSESVKTEKSVHQPMSSAAVQSFVIAEKAPSVKSDGEQSLTSPVASSEQKEITKKVDPAKLRAFHERNKKARAIFLAQNKSKQDQSNANSPMSMTSSPPSNPSETGKSFVALKTENVEEPSRASEVETKLIATDTKKFEKTCGDNFDINKLELADKSSDIHCKSMESQVPTEPKEVAESKEDSETLTTFFERNRKARALFLAQTKSKQKQDIESSHSEITSAPLVTPKPSETEKRLVAAPEPKKREESGGKDSDILELVVDSSDNSLNRFLCPQKHSTSKKHFILRSQQRTMLCFQ